MIERLDIFRNIEFKETFYILPTFNYESLK